MAALPKVSSFEPSKKTEPPSNKLNPALILKIAAVFFVAVGFSAMSALMVAEENNLIPVARECLNQHGGPFGAVPVGQWLRETKNCINDGWTREQITYLLRYGPCPHIPARWCTRAVKIGRENPNGLTLEHVRTALRGCKNEAAIDLAILLPQGKDEALNEILNHLTEKQEVAAMDGNPIVDRCKAALKTS
jgi:hypothetical protein